jgi:hypothetical protein
MKKIFENTDPRLFSNNVNLLVNRIVFAAKQTLLMIQQ